MFFLKLTEDILSPRIDSIELHICLRWYKFKSHDAIYAYWPYLSQCSIPASSDPYSSLTAPYSPLMAHTRLLQHILPSQHILASHGAYSPSMTQPCLLKDIYSHPLCLWLCFLWHISAFYDTYMSLMAHNCLLQCKSVFYDNILTFHDTNTSLMAHIRIPQHITNPYPMENHIRLYGTYSSSMAHNISASYAKPYSSSTVYIRLLRHIIYLHPICKHIFLTYLL